MELHEEVEKNPKAKNMYLFYHHLPNLKDEIHLKGVELYTLKFDYLEIELK